MRWRSTSLIWSRSIARFTATASAPEIGVRFGRPCAGGRRLCTLRSARIIDYLRNGRRLMSSRRRRRAHAGQGHPEVRLMRALVVAAPDDFAVRDVDRPAPGPFEVLCRVRVAAICGTDPHIIQGHYPGFWPKDWP